MKATIWKQRLDLTSLQEVTLPLRSEILCVQVQLGELCIWFRCDPNAPKNDIRTIGICGTGNEAPSLVEGWRYIGTAQTSGGQFVWHVFEAIKG